MMAEMTDVFADENLLEMNQISDHRDSVSAETETAYTEKQVLKNPESQAGKDSGFADAYTPAQKKLFAAVQPGDIIVAWMPLPPSKMARVQANHQKRPYVVVAKKKGHLLVYPCTSQKKNTSWNARFELGAIRYKMWKCGYVQICKPFYLPVSCLISRIDRLWDEDIAAINLIARKLSVRQIDKHYSLNVENGDIIRDSNKLYYVHINNKNQKKYYLLNRQGKKKAFSLYTKLGTLYPDLTPTGLMGVIDKSCVVCHSEARIRRLMEERIRP